MEERSSSRGAPALALALATLVALASCGERERPRVDPPARHVLLVVVDTLRADRVGAFGCPRGTSLAIDALARRGVRFENAIAQCSWTSPSVVSLLTSRYLADRRVALPTDVPALAELFQARGFGTAAFVTNPLLTRENGFARGFDRFVQRSKRLEDDPELLDWIRSRAGKPSFTYVHVTEPHDPYRPPKALVKSERVAASDSSRAAYAAEDAARGYGALEPAVDRIERELAKYDGEVRWADRTLQSVLRAMSEAGELADAAIAITADHGEGLWTHLDAEPYVLKRLENGEPAAVDTLFQKRHGCHLYQELIRVPLVLCAPSLPRNAVVSRLVENVDLAPTLLELAGIEPPRDMDGTSLVDALDGARWSKRAAFSMTRFARGIVTADGWKFVEPTPFGRTAGLETELFELASDPEERRNLVEERPELARELSARLADWASRALHHDADLEARELERSAEALRALGYTGPDGYESPPTSQNR